MGIANLSSNYQAERAELLRQVEIEKREQSEKACDRIENLTSLTKEIGQSFPNKSSAEQSENDMKEKMSALSEKLVGLQKIMDEKESELKSAKQTIDNHVTLD